MPRRVTAPPTTPFNAVQARRLTDLVKRDLDALTRELVRLHDGGAHTALGYTSWHAYCEAEFGFGRSHSHRLLDAGRVALVVPQLGNEAQARELAPLLREHGPDAVVELVRELRAETGGRLTAARFRHAVAARIGPTLPGDIDQAPPVPRRPRSRLGEVYQLGPHRLICGDATDPAVLAELLNGEQASMIWTDPPYGVNYTGRTADRLTIENDTAEGLRELLVGAWRAASPFLVESAPVYVAGPTGPTAIDFQLSFQEAGWRYRQQLVWEKDRMILGRQDYHLQHEAIYYSYTPGGAAGRMTSPDRFHWHGPDNATSVIKGVSAPSASRDHPTMKPIKLLIPHLQNSSLPGEIVLDLFAGSGTTMAAAHHTHRHAYLIELDPGYCDVIRQRWDKLKNTPAT